MKTKKLGIICTSPGFGGLELFTFYLAKALKNKEWQLFFLVNEKSALYEKLKPEFNVHSIQQFGKEKNAVRIIKKWNSQIQCKLLFTPYNKDLKPLSLYKRFFARNVKLIYQQHMKTGVKKKDFIHRMRYNMLDLWITALPYLKEETLAKTNVPSEKIKVVPVGLDFKNLHNGKFSKTEARHQLSLPQDAYLLGVLGRIDPKKGQDFLIKILNDLPAEKNIQLLIMGSATAYEGDEWMQHLHELVKQSSLENKVHFRPYEKDVALFYSAIDLFTMPSHGETYGLVTLEALYFEKPVIGVNTDGTKALLEDGKLGWLYELENKNEFKQQLNFILDNDAAVKEKILLAKRTVLSNYDFDNTVERMEELFEIFLSKD